MTIKLTETDIRHTTQRIMDHSTGAQGLRDCLLQLQHEAETRGYVLTAHLLAVAGDAILEDQMAHGADWPH